MNVGATFVAKAKTTEVLEPRMSMFDKPAEFAQSTAVFCAAPDDCILGSFGEGTYQALSESQGKRACISITWS